MLKSLILLSFAIFLLNACDSISNVDPITNKTKTLLQGKTMGTTYHVAIVHQKETTVDKHKLQISIDDLLKRLNQQVSTYIPNSQISLFNLNKSTDWITVDSEFFKILKAAQTVSEQSAGSFDISISPLVNLWGFGAKDQDELPTQKQIQQALTEIGYQKLTFNNEQHSLKKSQVSLQIDLSAIAKGFAVDKVSNLISKKGFSNHLVEIGGELRVSGTNQSNKKWRIAVEQPDLNSNVAKHGLEITNQAVATSGDYRNYFVEKSIRRSHIIDPKTGYPITHNLASVTVVDDSTMMADAYATALLVMGEKRGKVFVEEYKLDALMIIRNKDKFDFWSSPSFFD